MLHDIIETITKSCGSSYIHKYMFSFYQDTIIKFFSSLLQMDLPILVRRTLAGSMEHLGANTSPLPQARIYILHPSHNSQGAAPILGQPFRCERSHCREIPFEAGPVSFFVVLVRAQVVGRRSSPFNFLEKTRSAGCAARKIRKF